MCGILGVLNPAPADGAGFPSALRALAHRGPDGEGIWQGEGVLLGHRRLAIIDLTDDALQPMVDADSGAVIVYNGEIYNYLEVRAELAAAGERFRSHSDTEVLLKAYLRWGPAMLGRLNGMWAFAIWDPRTSQLFVSRDRFGVKPFYYAWVDGRFLFASEPKALFRLEPGLADPSPEAISEFFSTSEMHAGGKTFFRRVHSLPPATYGLVSASSPLATTEYWRYPDADEAGGNPFDFGDLLESAVQLRLRSDVPVGLTLSGGLDSSAILAASVAVAGRPLECFTSVYGDISRGEERWAQVAAGIAKAPLTSVESNVDDWHQVLRQAIHHMDSPSYSPAIVPAWAIMKQARSEGIPVLLEGQGADELLAGYPRYAPAFLAEMMRDRAGWAGLPGELAALRGSFGLKQLAMWSLRQAMPGAYRSWARVRGGDALLQEDFARQVPAASVGRGHGLFDLLKDDHSRQILPALLHYGDAISMAHGIESRLPFMDYRLVEQVFRTRPKLIVKGQTKAPVRDYLRREHFNPIADRLDKRGYPTPIHNWISGEGGQYLRDVLADRNSPIWTYLKPAATQALLNRATLGEPSPLFQAFKIATSIMWLENVATAHGHPSESAI